MLGVVNLLINWAYSFFFKSGFNDRYFSRDKINVSVLLCSVMHSFHIGKILQWKFKLPIELSVLC